MCVPNKYYHKKLEQARPEKKLEKDAFLGVLEDKFALIQPPFHFDSIKFLLTLLFNIKTEFLCNSPLKFLNSFYLISSNF